VGFGDRWCYSEDCYISTLEAAQAFVLQTALCYLEAIRPEVPNLLREERMGIRAYYQPESGCNRS